MPGFRTIILVMLAVALPASAEELTDAALAHHRDGVGKIRGTKVVAAGN